MITLKVRKLSGLYKIKGFLNSKNAYPVYFQTRFGIHTFSLKFPIEVVILDKNNCVVKLKENLKPNRIFLWNPIFDKIIELPSGETKRLKITLGTKLQLLTTNY
ncbi:MAG TPA: DUF192 domain-containing protein [Candidatus Saccharimonadales bacterium]|nr:DUF192 domain-containing protein [Candidatus Saccharimonadales bacterium]